MTILFSIACYEIVCLVLWDHQVDEWLDRSKCQHLPAVLIARAIAILASVAGLLTEFAFYHTQGKRNDLALTESRPD